MRNLFLFNLLIIILLINACAKTQQAQQQVTQKTATVVSSEDISALTPEQVVILYFQAWNDEQYDVMYSLISDGFKKIEPTAKTFEDFKSYMSKFYDTALGVRVIEAKEAYQSEKEAGVNYKIEIIKKEASKREFSNAYTLKKKASNASELTRSQVTGWKLIHPYGENIDTT